MLGMFHPRTIMMTLRECLILQSEPEADGARLRLLEPALLLRQICPSAPDFGAQVRLRQGAQTHTTQPLGPTVADPKAPLPGPAVGTGPRRVDA